MARKPTSASKDPSVIPMPWLDSAWAESADRYGSRFADTVSTGSRETINCLESMVDDQLAFMKQRLKADFECAKTLSECREPNDAAKVITDFWQTLFTDYAKATEKAGEQMNKCMAEAWTTTTAVTETAMEAANSAEEAITSMAKKTAA
ncbi:phasin family protein [Breoghania sp. L-A4]|uniref:phasin family protein n=1 Tax=Breoghania sp. L-A4 TaxID=2304600 RepID=UPI0013C2A909|nr:phasin family protein [Breoghania sp. L-A4]